MGLIQSTKAPTSQLPHKIVNLLFTVGLLYNKLTILSRSWLSKPIQLIHYARWASSLVETGRHLKPETRNTEPDEEGASWTNLHSTFRIAAVSFVFWKERWKQAKPVERLIWEISDFYSNHCAFAGRFLRTLCLMLLEIRAFLQDEFQCPPVAEVERT